MIEKKKKKAIQVDLDKRSAHNNQENESSSRGYHQQNKGKKKKINNRLYQPPFRVATKPYGNKEQIHKSLLLLSSIEYADWIWIHAYIIQIT